jgi:hypothetical protein
MHGLDRREFLLAGIVAASAAGVNGRRIWIDPRQAAMPNRPWRKIHLDFHNSQYVTKIGDKFDANEFGDRLAAAGVDSIVVFAKDMHGYFYYTQPVWSRASRTEL